MYAEWLRVSSEHGNSTGCRVSESRAAALVRTGGSWGRAVQVAASISDTGCLPSQPPGRTQRHTLALDNALVPLPFIRLGLSWDGD